jgi:hypothetical protein
MLSCFVLWIDSIIRKSIDALVDVINIFHVVHKLGKIVLAHFHPKTL